MKSPVEDTSTQKQQTISEEIKRLTEKQNTPKSFLSQLAAKYASYPWWIRWGLGGLFTALGGIVGFFVLPILFPVPSIIGAILGFVGYFVPTRVLKKHHQTELEYQQKLADEVLKLEAVLNESIQTIQSLEKPMHSLLDALDQKNKERAHSNQLFQSSVQSFRRQAEESEAAVQGLVEIDEEISKQSQKLSFALNETAETHEQLGKTEREIAKISEELHGTRDSLVKNVEVFQDMVSHIEQRNNELDVLYQKFRKIEADALKTQRAFEIHMVSLAEQQGSVSQYVESAEEREESSEALEAKVLSNLDKYLRGKENRFFKEPSAPKLVVSANEEILTHQH